MTQQTQHLDTFTLAYVECALWTSDESPGSGEWAQHDEWTVENIDPAALADMIEDCKLFQQNHAEDIGSECERAGHDFWLTRNHHGAGFLDGDWPSESARRLTDASHFYGSVDLYAGDDGRIYLVSA